MVNKVITSVLIMLTAWCTWNSANIGSHLNNDSGLVNETAINTRMLGHCMDRLDAIETTLAKASDPMPEVPVNVTE